MCSNIYLKSTLAKGYLRGLNLYHTDQKSQKATHSILETQDKGLGQADEECLNSGVRFRKSVLCKRDIRGHTALTSEALWKE